LRKYAKELLAVKSILPIVGNDTTEGTGAGVDLAGYESAHLLAEIGQSGDTLSGSVYLTIKFQESADNSNWADIADADLAGGENAVVIDDADEDEILIGRGYQGSKRYVRVRIEFTGTHTNGTPISGVVILGHARHAT